MPSTNDHDGALLPDGTLWLEVHHQGEARLFCCAPREERAIVLGSLPRADIRINAVGIAPVHFHFEREGNQLLLVPGYDAEVRVNSMLARGPVPIPEHALIEFAGMRIEAVVRTTPPEHRSYPSLDIPDQESGIKYLAALPTDTQTTKLALEPFPRVENLQAAIETRETPLELSADFSRTQTIERPELDLQATQVMERLQVVTAEIPATPQHTVRMERVPPETFRPTTVEVTPIIETRHLRPVQVLAATAAAVAPAPPPPEIPSSPAGLGWQETTAFDLDGLRADLAPAPVVTPKAHAAEGATHLPPRQEPPSAVVEGSSPPLARSTRPTSSASLSRAVSRVGEHAKAKPLAVGAGALGSALVLALLMVGVSHVVGVPKAGSRSTHAASGVRSADTVNSPQAAPTSQATTDAPSKSVAIASTPPMPSTAEQRGDTPEATLSVKAASHLIAGRYIEARAAYAELGTAYPENPAFQTISRLLGRRTTGSCNGAGTAPSCPEIVQ